jgi:hypothetical protein
MSSLLFLGFVGGFVLIAYWAFKNDGMASGESGAGLLAMQQPAGAKQKSVPKWKKNRVTGTLPRPVRSDAVVAKPLWRKAFHRKAR